MRNLYGSERKLSSNNLEIVPSVKWGDKFPALKYKGKFVHSKYDPVKEAKLLIERSNIENADFIFVIGAGLGYTVDIIKRKIHGNVSIVIIEKLPELKDILTKYTGKNMLLLCGVSPEEILRILKQKFNVSKIKNPVFIENKILINLDMEYYQRVKQAIVNFFKTEVSDLTTGAYFSKLWIENFFANLPYISEFSLLSYYPDYFKDMYGILVAGGPGAEEKVNKIKNSKGVIFALPPAVNFLLNHKIIPDFIISGDAGFSNFYHFKKFFKNKNLKLITDLSIHPSIIKNFKGKVILVDFGMPANFILKNFFPLPEIPIGGTISFASLLIMKYLGIKKIFLSGQDFAYMPFKTHLRGSGYELYYINRISKRKNLINFYYDEVKNNKIFKINNEWISDEKLKLYKEWFYSQKPEDIVFLDKFPEVFIKSKPLFKFIRLNKNGLTGLKKYMESLRIKIIQCIKKTHLLNQYQDVRELVRQYLFIEFFKIERNEMKLGDISKEIIKTLEILNLRIENVLKYL